MSFLDGPRGAELWKMVKFGITGVANTLVDTLVYTLLAAWLGVSVYLAQVCGYMAGMLNSYLVNRSWTFQTSSRFFSMQMVKFIVANLLTLAVSIGMLKLLIDLAGLGAIIAKLPTICVTILLNFLLSRFWVFR